MGESLKLDDYRRPRLRAPGGAGRVLLHSCCAPCAGEIIDAVLASDLGVLVFFYNPNIHPAAEYEIRKRENIRFCEKRGAPFLDADYDMDNWFLRVRGLENEPERGRRCTACFDMRFERAALYAAENGFSVFSSTLGISRWKDMEQINGCGRRAAARWPGLSYWDFNWRKGGGSQRMVELSKREQFYKQEYCGCVYSLRDTNKWRRQNDRPRVERGIKFYGRGGA
ncbi:MAG: epoxyqueuosine reductase QueH [Betaproteobacteria bacterium]|nr:epoxyqueuosine reductase QueH [Betaproteobacteria bacterium]